MRRSAMTAAAERRLRLWDACADRFVLGDETSADWQHVDLAEHSAALWIGDAVVSRGRGGDALGDPRVALTWLANWAANNAGGLRAGQIVTTGVCGRPTPVAPGDRVIADFGSFGQVELSFSQSN